MPPLGAYVITATIAAVVTFLVMFPVRRVAERVGFVAEPDDRRIHTRVTPYGGGAAMFVGFLVALLVASQLPGLQDVFRGSSEPLGLVLASAVIFAVGLIDDFRDMSAPAKMAGQVLAAMVLVFFGLTMFQFKIPTVGFLVLSPDVLPLLTALWVIVITNAVNLIDGLDGLAAGIVATASGALAVYGLRLVDLGVLPATNLGPLIAVVAFGVCVGFLPHNFHPARAFMGDAGALFVGLLMAAATMEIGGRTPDVSGQSYFFFAPLLIPLFILGVPIADMAFAFVRRTAKGTGFHTPDKDHVHHRLLRLGHGQRRTVVILCGWTALLSVFVLIPLFGGRGNRVIPLGAVALGLALFTWFHPGLRKNTNAAATTDTADAATAGGDDAGADGGEVPVADGGEVPVADGGEVPVAATVTASNGLSTMTTANGEGAKGLPAPDPTDVPAPIVWAATPGAGGDPGADGN